MRWLRRGLQTVVALGIAYVGAVGAAPVLGVRVPGSDRLFEAQLTSFPAFMLLALAALLGVLFLVVIIAIARRRRPSTATALLALLTVLAAVPWSGLLPVAQAHPAAASGARQIKVASWNTEAQLTADGLVALLESSDPDVIVLPETQERRLADALKDPRLAVAKNAYQMFVSPEHDFVAPVAVLINKRLGSYHVVTQDVTTYGSLTLEPLAAGLPTIVGVHSASPIPAKMEQWRADLGRISRLAGCEQAAPKPVIVAGDFNATLTHGSLAVRSHCADAQSAVGSAWAHTWPTDKPSWMGTTIDHVLLGGGVAPLSTQVATIEDSDHRAVFATVALPR